MPVRTRQPGDPLAIPAAEWNLIAGVVNSFVTPAGEKSGPQRFSKGPGLVTVKNTTGSAFARFQPIELAGPLLSATDQPDAFLESPSFAAGVVSETDLPPGRLAIAAESIPAGQLGRAILYGAHPLLATVTNADHRFLRAVSGQALLESCSSGQIRIIGTPAGTGEQAVIASVTLEPRPLEIDALITDATLLSGEANRWSYTWSEVLLDGSTRTTDGATRTSAADGEAINTMEIENAATGVIGSGIDTANIPAGFDVVPIGPGVVRLRRGTDAATWYFSAENQLDGVCE